MRISIDEVLEEDGEILAVSGESPFYPDGKGGQLGDRGEIGGRRVLRVFRRRGRTFHVLDGPLTPGDYEVRIDLDRRKEIARQHTAQHILSASFLKVADVETVSFRMGEEYSTVDLDVSMLLEEVMWEAEDLSNEVVMESREVRIHVVDREDAEKFPLRKPVPDGISEVRIVEIDGFDWSACSGFHVSRTGEIGLIKIIDWEKVKGSLTRVYFVAGMRALRVFRDRLQRFRELSKILTSSVDEMPSRISNLISDLKGCRKDLERLALEHSKVLMSNLLDGAPNVGGTKVVVYEGIEEVGKHLLKEALDCEDLLMVVKVEDGYEFASSSVNVGKILKELREKVGGRGGGGEKRGRLSLDVSKEELLKALEGVLTSGGDAS